MLSEIEGGAKCDKLLVDGLSAVTECDNLPEVKNVVEIVVETECDNQEMVKNYVGSECSKLQMVEIEVGAECDKVTTGKLRDGTKSEDVVELEDLKAYAVTECDKYNNLFFHI